MSMLQKLGGFAALAAASTFVVGFWVYFTLLIPAKYGSMKIEALQHAAFLVGNRSILYAWNPVIYVAFGMFLAVLVLALYALNPAQAALVWLNFNGILNGLGGGNEIVGGLWSLLTTIPPLKELGAAFGLGLIAWFAWAGIVLLRSRPATSVKSSA